MAMKKFLNHTENLVDELLEGYTAAYPTKVKLTENNLVTRVNSKQPGRVALVSLAGSGHEPTLTGFVGAGLLDVAVPGQIFAAPGPPRCVEALRLAERGAGTLFLVLNHEGDVLSSDLALEEAQEHGMPVRRVLVADDISAAPRDRPEDRRGLVGFLPVVKVAGAAAEAGRSLDDVVSVAEHMAANVATLSVATTSATHPATGEPFFEMPDTQMEIGMGAHGEAGTGRGPMRSADDTADMMTPRLVEDLALTRGDRALVIVNGTGATTLMELYLVFRRVYQVLNSRGIEVSRALVGEYMTVQEQGGFQLMLARLDTELLELWDAPCDSAYLTVAQ